MRRLEITKQFKKDFKKASKNPRRKINKLLSVVDILREQGELPTIYLPHRLVSNWKPHWECHIQPDFLLIYEVNDEYVKLARCGSHSELF